MCGRGASFADVNNDGRQDLFVANYRLDPDFLLINTGEKTDQQEFLLADMAEEFNVRGHNDMGAYGHSIGGAWGYLDKNNPALFVASLAHPRLLGLSDTSALYLPSPEKKGLEPHFEDLGFFYQETYSDPSFVDVDLDGDLDLFITSTYRGCPSVLYLNQGGKFTDVAWLSGAREITAGRGTGNQDEAIAHFGLGDDKGPFKVTVNYPSGVKVVLDNVTCRMMIEVNEP